MRNKKLLGCVLAAMLSVSMAAGICAADFGNGDNRAVLLTADAENSTQETNEAEVSEDSQTPEATPTPDAAEIPDITPTPDPTEIPDITPTPDATETPDITPTPDPTEIPDITPTPDPTVIPDITPTPDPTEIPDITPTPDPTEIPDITPTPDPTEIPDITPTPDPTETPDITPTPDPTETPAPELIDISSATVKLGYETLKYTGSARKQTVTVTYEGEKLKKGTDYTVSYSDNVEIGTATVTVEGIGRFDGEAEANFQIVLASPTVKKAVSVAYNATQITWAAVPGAKKYTVYYKGGNVMEWTAIETGITGTTYKHVSSIGCPLTAGTTYTYTVKAVKGKNVSTYGTSTKTVKPIPATVTLGKVTSAAYNKQKITWSKVAGATGYIVFQKVNDKWVRVGKTSETSFINKNKKAHPILTGVTNTYTVRAYRTVGNTNVMGKYSKTGISGKALLDVPSISGITATSKGLKLKWGKIAGAKGYVIQRYESGEWVTIKTTKKKTVLSYTDTTAEENKTYQYRIAAYCEVNGKSFYSVYSAIESGTR